EHLGHGRGAVVAVEAVGLVDLDPGQLAALAGQLVAESGVFLLVLEQLCAGGLPLLAAGNLVGSHRVFAPCARGTTRARSARPRSPMPSPVPSPGTSRTVTPPARG